MEVGYARLDTPIRVVWAIENEARKSGAIAEAL